MRLILDLEANGLYHSATTIWCICAKDVDTGEKYEWTIEYVGKYFNKFEEDILYSASELVGHNIINYDLPLLKKLWNWEPNENTKITDTLVMSRLANPDRPKPPGYTGKSGPHGLDAWGYRSGSRKLHHEEWSVFSPAMLRRCRQDVEINHFVYRTVSEELKEFSNDSIELEHNIARIITEQEIHGIRFDKDRAERYIEDLTRRIEEIDMEVIPKLPKELEVIGAPILNPFLKTGKYRKVTKEWIDAESFNKRDERIVEGPFTRVRFNSFDIGSISKVKQYLLDNGWKPDSWNFSKTTGERTSPKLEGEFAGIDGEVPKIVKERITLRHRRSQIEGWVRDAVPDTGVRLDSQNHISICDKDSPTYDYWKLYAGANPLGAPTGRMYHNTVVNIPKASTDKETGELCWDVEEQGVIYGTQMRSLFIPREGFVIAGHDIVGVELRMLAHYMNDEEFTKELLSGDIHTYNQIKAGLPTRAAAKTFIYALIYGAGNEKIGSIVGGDGRDGLDIKESYFSQLPKLRLFVEKVKRAAGKGYIRGLDGRKLWCRREEDGRVNRRAAPNLLLQGAAAIVHKKGCEILWKEVKERGIWAHKILDMHDEGQSEVRNLPEHIEPYKELAVNSIVKAGEYYKLNIPLAAEVKVGINLAETH